MIIEFNGEKYSRKAKKNTYPLRELCFDIFDYFLKHNQNKTYEEIQNIFNPLHCTSNQVVMNEQDWENLTDNQKQRYYDVVDYNNMKLYFTTQWGNNGIKNGKDCDNVNHVIDFAKSQNYEIKIIEEETKIELNNKNKIMKTKNIMLYGAPGVGKTYNYKKLIALIEGGDFNEGEIFDFIINNKDHEIKEGSIESLYEEIKTEKRVEFVTFHQSYSYEDFIEGFRPNEDGKIKLEDGIFKKISDEARINIRKSKNNGILLFHDAVDKFLKEKIENQEAVKINLKRNNSFYTIYDYNNKTIYFEKQNGDQSHSLSLKTLEKMYYEEDNTIINGGLAPYYNPLLEKLLEIKNNVNVKTEEQKNFYIIIDEINRGNISKIFGELITLIEEDKRGKKEYEVTLPYSKEKFLIPENLYIIATMNSTDKSIATIDIALRRRFTFLKMMPDSSLVEYENAKVLMDNLNKFIKDTINEDYHLGHSYFMNINNEDELDFVKEYKIKPLLEEYFYGDETSLTKSLDILNNS